MSTSTRRPGAPGRAAGVSLASRRGERPVHRKPRSPRSSPAARFGPTALGPGAHGLPMRHHLRLLRLLISAFLGFVLLVPVTAWSVPAWAWPLAGLPTVVRGFEPPPLPWAPGHRGVDLRARAGAAVLAAGAGVVGFAGMLAGRGVVSVHHADGLETTYEPLEVLVHPGERVALGQLLGRMTPEHGSCGLGYVCLHWGLRRGATYLDPLQLVRPRHIRLLPLWSGVPQLSPIGAAPASRDGGAPEASPP